MFEVIHILYRAFFNFCFFSSDIFRISLVCIFQSILYSHSRILLIFFLCFFFGYGAHTSLKNYDLEVSRKYLFLLLPKSEGDRLEPCFTLCFFCFSVTVVLSRTERSLILLFRFFLPSDLKLSLQCICDSFNYY